MADKSSIEWTDATWNPTRGCTKVAQGCKHCYAETFAERWRGVAGNAYEQGFDPRTAPDQLTLPLKWKKPRRIFVDSMSDLFHEAFDFDYIAAVFGVMAACPQHTFQVLTKRPERAAAFFAWINDQGEELRANVGGEPPSGHAEPSACALFLSQHVAADVLDDVQGAVWPLPNVWIGTSIAEQKDADKNIPHLLQIPAAVRFLSVEPLIAPVNLSRVGGTWSIMDARHAGAISWVIVGGESGHGARPCNVEWIRSIVAQCKAASVPVFVKQLGAQPFVTDQSPEFGAIETAFGVFNLRDRKGGDWSEWPEDLRIRQFPEAK